jgi:hypothetical protein
MIGNRFIVRVGAAVSLALMVATASGCAANDDGGAGTDEASAVKGDLPDAVKSAADSLKLGAAKSSEGAAGHLYFDFEKGTVSYSNVRKKVDGVKFHDASLDELSRNAELSGDVAKAAIYLGVGAFKHTEGAAGSQNYEFEHAVVRYSNVSQTISTVTFNGEMMGELSGDVLAITLSLELGKYNRSEGAAGSTYYDFERGFIQWSNVTQSLVGTTVKDGSLASESKEIALPADVVLTAVKESLGRLTGAQGGAGHAYYEFEEGTVDYSNVENKVLGVIRDQ